MKQKRLWEGAFAFGQFLLFHEYEKGEDGRPRYRDWAAYPLKGNEDLPYLKRPNGEIIERAKNMRELKKKLTQ